ncbi:hypothetical protein BT63DRAFT_457954 [Microthyrium microscopicum]|uniref:Mediator of RNA polymerase II transcription subunit 11 n=1 Tax=Microthyrium microscopicum TaxID=703497 RepID=A0A6A6U6C5_9PEZI|nr:hypothetical protein BT63DRAFT_457954 [Microthyrium microscopicum]
MEEDRSDNGSENGSESEPQVYGNMDNLKVLVALSRDVPNLLQSAGSAIALLSDSTHNAELLAEADGTALEARKAGIQTHVRDYFKTLFRLKQILLQQSYALEEAGILLPVEDTKSNGGMGAMDVAVLNSRSRDVGLRKEKELVKEATEWLEQAKESEGAMDTGK